MAADHNIPKLPGGQAKPQSGQTHYVFKSASEMPRIKPDYVVQSPTPLGQRSVDRAEKRK
jgi:hypothetical protein